MAASSALSQDAIFFSQSNTSGSPSDSQTFTYNSLGSHTLYIWATDGTQVSPATASTATGWPRSLPPTTAYFSYDLGVTGALASAISLTAGAIDNFPILNGSGVTFTRDTDWDGGQPSPTPPATVMRWNSASNFTLADVSHVSPGAITGLNAVVLPVPTTSTGTPTGVDTNIHTGLSVTPDTLYSGPQPGYSAATHAFLLGEVTFTINSVNSPGDTVLHVNPSTTNPPASIGSAIGTSNATGSSPNFVATYNNLSPNFNLGAATINVVPEPASWSLLAVGAVALLSFGRRRALR